MLYSYLFATLIAASPVGDKEIYLYSDKRNCENGYYAELISNNAVVDTGCWAHINGNPHFLVRWNSDGSVTRHEKEGTRPIISV